MLKLDKAHIAISKAAKVKEEAIREVAFLMVANGFVGPDYVDGMFERERQISTYLDNGIAIPHGTTDKRDSVLNTGVQVIFYPEGIDWDGANKVRLVVGIAAKSTEHLDILRSLTHSVMDKDLGKKLDSVKTIDDIHGILTGQAVNSVSESVEAEPEGCFSVFTLRNENGLHARPCAELVKIAKRFDSDIQAVNMNGVSDKPVSAKSMMKLISLGVKSGHKMKFYAKGADADKALEAIGEGIKNGLGEAI